MQLKRKALLINEGFSDNLGDQAIKRSIEKLLFELGYSVDFEDFTKTLLSPEPLMTNSVKRVKRKKNKIVNYVSWFFRNIARVFNSSRKDYDLVVMGGGQLILSNSYFPIAFFVWVFMLKTFRRPVVVFSVGIAEKFNYVESSLYLSALKLVDGHCYRDHESFVKAKIHFGLENIEYIPDSAYLLKDLGLTKQSTKKALVGIVDYEVYLRYRYEINAPFLSEHEYMSCWAKWIFENVDRYNSFGLVYTTSADYRQSLRFYEFLKETFSTNNIALESIESLDDFTALLATSDCIFSGRMHGLILGIVYECQIIPWIISKKLESFVAGSNYLIQGSCSNQDEIKLKLKRMLCRMQIL